MENNRTECAQGSQVDNKGVAMQSNSYPLRWLFAAILYIGLSAPLQARADALECGELKNYQDIGPWDYADPSSNVPTGADPMGHVKRVENVHFTPEMQTLNLKRFSIDRLTDEIHYTLRILPNHPGALMAISRLERMAGGKLPQRTVTPFTPKITADCFFDRAIRFRPQDKAVRMIHGMHLQQHGMLKEALAEYEKAQSLGEDSANLSYNLGLLYAELNNWDKAYEYGEKAQRGGFMLPGLRNRLEKAGRPLPPPPVTPIPKGTATSSENVSQDTTE